MTTNQQPIMSESIVDFSIGDEKNPTIVMTTTKKKYSIRFPHIKGACCTNEYDVFFGNDTIFSVSESYLLWITFSIGETEFDNRGSMRKVFEPFNMFLSSYVGKKLLNINASKLELNRDLVYDSFTIERRISASCINFVIEDAPDFKIVPTVAFCSQCHADEDPQTEKYEIFDSDDSLVIEIPIALISDVSEQVYDEQERIDSEKKSTALPPIPRTELSGTWGRY